MLYFPRSADLHSVLQFSLFTCNAAKSNQQLNETPEHFRRLLLESSAKAEGHLRGKSFLDIYPGGIMSRVSVCMREAKHIIQYTFIHACRSLHTCHHHLAWVFLVPTCYINEKWTVCWICNYRNEIEIHNLSENYIQILSIITLYIFSLHINLMSLRFMYLC